MKIIELRAENIKRVKAVTIRPDGSVVEVKGRNAQGKTSTLDAIWMALGWKQASKSNPNPIHDGAKTAEVVLDLGEYVVRRNWTEKGSYLKVELASANAELKKPQEILDGLIGSFTFDPLGWAQMEPKKQRESLLGMIDLGGLDLAELEAERADIFERRTGVNRQVKDLAGQLNGLTPPEEDTPEEEVSASAIVAQLQEANSQIALNNEKRQALESRVGEISSKQEEIDRAEERVLALKEEKAELLRSGAALEAEVAGLTDPDTEAINDRLSRVEQTNDAVRQAHKYRQVQAQHQNATDEAQSLTDSLTALDERKNTTLEAAAFPVPGLGFDEGGVTYNGQPFEQASDGEKLRVSMAVAMALNPELRVIRITNGSLLDADNMAIIENLATAHDYQVWIERVADAPDGAGVYIEDGEVSE